MSECRGLRIAEHTEKETHGECMGNIRGDIRGKIRWMYMGINQRST